MKANYLNPKIYVADAPNSKGKGLFAKEKIYKGEVITDTRDANILTKEEVSKLSLEQGQYCYETDDNHELCPKDFENLPPAFYMNHSCDANVGSPPDIYSSVAMRDVLPGEEITYDYAMTDSSDYEMECLCGASDCRKLIRGTDWMISVVQKKYLGYFQSNIQAKIDAQNKK